MATRYQVFRRVIAPVALLAALALLAYDTCRAEERAEVPFAIDFGDDAPAVRHVRVDLWSGDDTIGFFERAFGDQGVTATPRWRQPVPDGPLEATISVTLADGTIVPLRRTLDPAGGEILLDARIPGR